MASGRHLGVTALIAALTPLALGTAGANRVAAAETAVEGIDDRWIFLGVAAVILASFLALLHRRNTVTGERHHLRERIATDLAWLLDDGRATDGQGRTIDDADAGREQASQLTSLSHLGPHEERPPPDVGASHDADPATTANELRRRSARAIEDLTTLADGASGELAAAASDLATRVADLSTVLLGRVEGSGDRLRHESRVDEVSERVRVAQDRLHNALDD